MSASCITSAWCAQSDSNRHVMALKAIASAELCYGRKKLKAPESGTQEPLDSNQNSIDFSLSRYTIS